MADRLCREPTRPVQSKRHVASCLDWELVRGLHHFIRASGRLSAASKGRIHDRTQPLGHQKKPLHTGERPYMDLAPPGSSAPPDKAGASRRAQLQFS